MGLGAHNLRAQNYLSAKAHTLGTDWCVCLGGVVGVCVFGQGWGGVLWCNCSHLELANSALDTNIHIRQQPY